MTDYEKFGRENDEMNRDKERVYEEIEASEELNDTMPLMPPIVPTFSDNASNDVITDSVANDVIGRTETESGSNHFDKQTMIDREEEYRKMSAFPKMRKNKLLGMFSKEKQEERAEKRALKRAARDEKRAEAFERKRERLLNPMAAKEEKREKALMKKRRKIEAAEEKKRERYDKSIAEKAEREEQKRRRAEERYEREVERRNEKREMERLKHTDKDAYKRAMHERKERVHAMKIERREKAKAEAKRRTAEKRAALNSLREKGIRVGASKGMIAAVIVLAITTGLMTIAAGIFLGTTVAYSNGGRENNVRSYYQLVMDMNNLETALSKATVAKSAGAQSIALSEANAYAVSAADSLSELPANEDEQIAITTYFNEVGALTESLAVKSANGEKLSSEEAKLIDELVNYHEELKETVNSEFEKNSMNENLYKRNALTRKLADNPLVTTYSAFTEKAATLPIAKKAAAKTASANAGNMTKEEAMRLVNEALSASSVNCDGECDGEYMTYNFAAKANGKDYFVQVSKQSGKITYISSYAEVGEATVTVTECSKIAEEFAKKVGYENVKKVWAQNDSNVAVITLATSGEGRVAYTEKLLVKVSMESGEILGFEAKDYAASYDEARSYKAKLTEAEARTKVSDKLDVTQTRLAYIPVGDEEMLVYEFTGNYDGKTFAVYINANSGEEVKILRVLSGENGDTVL